MNRYISKEEMDRKLRKIAKEVRREKEEAFYQIYPKKVKIICYTKQGLITHSPSKILNLNDLSSAELGELVYDLVANSGYIEIRPIDEAW